jgi:hemolysin activation/secretion protein
MGANYTLPSQIKASLPELAEGKVPDFNQVQAELTALNTGAAKVTPILRAGKKPGTVEVQLDVEDQMPLHGSLEWSNRQSPNTTAQRVSASLRYDNLWQRSHSFGLSLQVAPQRPSDSKVISGTYVLPVNSTGNSLTIYAVHSVSQFANLPGMEGLGLLGNSDTLGTRLSIPLGNTAEYTQNISIGLDYKDIKQTTAPLQGGSGIDQPIRYVPLVATYSGTLFGQNRSTVLDVTATTGLRGVFGNNDNAFENKRSGASASYLLLRTWLQHTRSFARWSLYGKLEMQESSGMLVPTEQYTAGGAESVRGYLESEIAGDRGLRATIELRLPQISLGGQGSAWRLTGLTHLDWARLTTLRQPGDVLPEVQRLRSRGFGVRIIAPRDVTIELNAARALIADPLRDGAGTVTGYTTRAGQWRGQARALWAF